MFNDPTLKGVFQGLLDDVTRLGRQELALAKAEIAEDIDAAQKRLIAIMAGLMLGFCAVLILLQAVVVALATQMPAWLASVIVALVVGLAAVILVRGGQAGLSRKDVTPERTVRSLKRDKDMVMEKAS